MAPPPLRLHEPVFEHTGIPQGASPDGGLAARLHLRLVRRRRTG
jgi:hypothetical protein